MQPKPPRASPFSVLRQPTPLGPLRLQASGQTKAVWHCAHRERPQPALLAMRGQRRRLPTKPPRLQHIAKPRQRSWSCPPRGAQVLRAKRPRLSARPMRPQPKPCRMQRNRKAKRPSCIHSQAVSAAHATAQACVAGGIGEAETHRGWVAGTLAAPAAQRAWVADVSNAGAAKPTSVARTVDCATTEADSQASIVADESSLMRKSGFHNPRSHDTSGS